MSNEAPLIGIERHRLATDGQGVTTLVAFHGCPLSCRYCLNPQCLRPEGVWRRVSPEMLYEELAVDNIYFLATGGGVTFGGGEPCLQSRFIARLHALCGDDWRITLETSLHVARHHLEVLLPVVNEWIVDVKDMNNDVYERYTGQSNQLVKSNLEWLAQQGRAADVVVRVPLIPYYNTRAGVQDSIGQLRRMGFERFDEFDYMMPAGPGGKRQSDLGKIHKTKENA